MTNEDDNRSEKGKSDPPRRILAGLGSVADEIRTIETALALARALRAEITGYFVEESSFLDLAGLPFAKAMRPAGRSAQPIEPSQMEREFVQAAATWQRTLSAGANRCRVTCTFQTARGEYCSEIAKAAVETDIVIVNPANVPLLGRAAMAAVLDAMGSAAGIALLPERGRTASEGPVVLVIEDIPNTSVFRLAERIATATGNDPVVLIWPNGERHAQELRAKAEEALGADIRVDLLPRPAPSDAIGAIEELRPSFVIWPGGARRLRDEDAEHLLRATGAPLLLLRDLG